MGRPKGSSNKSKQAIKRPDIPDKEHLIAYLEANAGIELPFVEEVWEQAVIKAEEAQNQVNPTKEVTITDIDGNVTTKVTPAGTRVTDPVKYYFRLMGLQQNRNKAILIQESKVEESESKREILNTYFDDDVATEYVDEITSWIALFPPQERQFLKQRYASYYDTYDINDGADKGSLKGLLSLEVELHRIDIRRAGGKSININDEKKLREMFDNTFQSLKWTKKQRNAREDMAQNKFTIFMDKLVKDGEFKNNPKHYDPDEIDFIINTSLEAQKEMLT